MFNTSVTQMSEIHLLITQCEYESQYEIKEGKEVAFSEFSERALKIDQCTLALFSLLVL